MAGSGRESEGDFRNSKIREKERGTARFTARREDWTDQSNPLLRFLIFQFLFLLLLLLICFIFDFLCVFRLQIRCSLERSGGEFGSPSQVVWAGLRDTHLNGPYRIFRLFDLMADVTSVRPTYIVVPKSQQQRCSGHHFIPHKLRLGTNQISRENN
jgi:hypothetical protein